MLLEKRSGTSEICARFYIADARLYLSDTQETVAFDLQTGEELTDVSSRYNYCDYIRYIGDDIYYIDDTGNQSQTLYVRHEDGISEKLARFSGYSSCQICGETSSTIYIDVSSYRDSYLIAYDLDTKQYSIVDSHPGGGEGRYFCW
ncbi:hypothetical protein MR857_07765 [bacterium]|nr:hypothetical protein [bacterium]MDY3021203.1 hypothetical protein [Oliverpabstia sp.]